MGQGAGADGVPEQALLRVGLARERELGVSAELRDDKIGVNCLWPRTVVATAAVHWPAEWGSLGALWEGYVITAKGAGNFKLPLLFVGMLLPLVFYGGGRLSLDHVLLKITGRDTCVTDRIGDGIAAALMFAVLGVTTIWVEPSWGITFLVAALIVGLVPALRR